MSQAKSVIQTMENTNMHLLVLFGTASCLLTALKGLPLNLGSISLEGGCSGKGASQKPLHTYPVKLQNTGSLPPSSGLPSLWFHFSAGNRT